MAAVRVTGAWLSTALLLFAAIPAQAREADASEPRVQARQFGLPALGRHDFNRLAMHANSPLFWRADGNDNGKLDPGELAVIGIAASLKPYVRAGKFTRRFGREYRAMVERRRAQAVRQDLDAGRPTLVHSDLRHISPAEKRMVRLLVQAARLIDRLYFRQTGAAEHIKSLARATPASRALFRRNSGPWCTAPQTRNDAFCNALAHYPQRRSENYPTNITQDDAMCRQLERQENATELLAPFSVVRRSKQGFAAVPLHRAYGAEMAAIAARLSEAASQLDEEPEDKSLRQYLVAAAKAFKTNDWDPADEAWAAMSSDNSKWYLRVGPDEVYQDVCQRKAAFHLVLARIDRRSLLWKRRLMPLRREMESSVATLLGKDYRARRIDFEMPDFIKIVLNAGDSKHPLGATIGQSLPNWGKVAREGRGRTVVMTNLYTDPDSRLVAREQAKALLDKATLGHFSDSSDPSLLVTILHEASHNFGPHSDYRVHGKAPAEVFGGRLASTLEELKAQTTGLWFLQLLRRRGLLSEQEVRGAYTKALMWAFGHLARGLRTASGNARPYSQLAAVHLGHMLAAGALVYKGGRFALRYERLATVMARLAQRVGRIKARGDVSAAKQLLARFTSAAALHKLRAGLIRRQMLRFAKASFRYAVSL